MNKYFIWAVSTVCSAALLFAAAPAATSRSQNSAPPQSNSQSATAPRQNARPADSTNFENIQVLTMMTDREIQQTMQRWSQQFGVSCFACHVLGDFASDMLERKRVAREMAKMVQTLNQTDYFRESGRQADCYVCHKGSFDTPMFADEESEARLITP